MADVTKLKSFIAEASALITEHEQVTAANVQLQSALRNEQAIRQRETELNLKLEGRVRKLRDLFTQVEEVLGEDGTSEFTPVDSDVLMEAVERDAEFERTMEATSNGRFPPVGQQISDAEFRIAQKQEFDAAVEQWENEAVEEMKREHEEIMLGHEDEGVEAEDKEECYDCASNNPPEELEHPEQELKSLNRAIRMDNIKAALVGTRCALLRSVAIFGSAPFLLLLALGVMANHGIYVEPLRMFWVAWIPGLLLQALGFAVPSALTAIYVVFCRKPVEKSVVSEEMPEELPEAEVEVVMEKEVPLEPEVQSRLSKLKTFFPANKITQEKEPTFDATLARQLAAVFNTDDEE